MERIKYWDDNICQGHINSEASFVINYFKEKNINNIKFIDIGANVGKYYDTLSQHVNIDYCVMYEGSKILSEYLTEKFISNKNVEVYNYAISNEDKDTFFDESSIKYFLNKEDIDGINLGLSNVSSVGGTNVEMRDISSLLNDRYEFFSDFDFIKIDTETVDYLILESLSKYIVNLDKKPLICFEHNYHNTISGGRAKKIYNDFKFKCGYDGLDFEDLGGDVLLTPNFLKTEFIGEIKTESLNIVNNTKHKTNVLVHNPSNTFTKNYRDYNRFWDDLTDYLKNYFNVYENRFFENAHIERYPVKLKKGSSDDFLLLECEYVIENLDNGEFVIMSVSDDITHAILNEQSNPYLKKVLVSQFLPKKIHDYTKQNMFKYSPWTYFQALVIDLEPYYIKRKSISPNETKLYFRGTSLEDRSILRFFNKEIITDFNPIIPDSYFNDLINHKIALSVDGRGEFCYRDIECFGVGVPIIRFEYNSKFYKNLIPNYHYISIDRPSDMDLYRTGNEEHVKLLEQRYQEVINDDEFLSFISNNARKYYEDNILQINKLKNTFNLLNLNDWQ
jgi:FkbM family methyltransferase